MANDSDLSIRRSVVDGVPVYWTPELPSVVGFPGCAGALLFRVGCADETVKTCGITHLVEHLVLHQFGSQPAHYLNGLVSGTHTRFDAQGTPAEVTSFMLRVCEGVTQLPLARLEAESRVLRTEATSRGYSFEHRMLFLRYGARGIGQLGLAEFGLEAPDAAALEAWAAARFTRENATAWFLGTIPADLSFAALPRGERHACPVPQPIADLRTPAVFNTSESGEQHAVGLSFVLERQRWIMVPLEIARRRLTDRLRFQEGVTYEIVVGVTPITARHSHATLWAGCLPEHAALVQKAVLEALDELAAEGPRQDELDTFRREFLLIDGKEYGDLSGNLEHRAANELMGYPVQTIAEYEANFAQRSRADWAESMRVALESLLMMLPQECEPLPDRFHSYPQWSRQAVRGRRFRAAGPRFPWRRKSWGLVVGADGVSLVSPHGHAVTVTYAQCAGAILRRDGTLQLIGDDGFWVTIEPAVWRHGKRAHATVLDALPRDRLVVVPAP